MTDIWYAYLKTTGEYMGSGTPHYDDATYGSTLTPVPDYPEGATAYWTGTAWEIRNA
jgi:hypothetical protein